MERHEYEAMRQLEERHWWFLGRRAIVSTMMRRLMPRAGDRPRRILDFGCGTGGNTEFFSTWENVEVDGVDVNARAVALCHERGLSQVRQIPFEGWSPEPETYDLAVAFDVMEHIEFPERPLQAIWRGVKPGGAVLITIPACPSLWSGHDVSLHHFRRYTPDTLRELAASAGLGAWTGLTYFNTMLFPPTAAVRWLRPASTNGHRKVTSDTATVPPEPLNSMLAALFASERWWIGRWRPPIGVSLMAWKVKS